MPRRTYTYGADMGWNGWNMFESISAFCLGASFSCCSSPNIA